jgi:hypothetical protein
MKLWPSARFGLPVTRADCQGGCLEGDPSRHGRIGSLSPAIEIASGGINARTLLDPEPPYAVESDARRGCAQKQMLMRSPDKCKRRCARHTGQRPKDLPADQMRKTPKRTRGGGSTTVTSNAPWLPGLTARWRSGRTRTAMRGKTGALAAECGWVSTDCESWTQCCSQSLGRS